jgi:hypothetical protein
MAEYLDAEGVALCNSPPLKPVKVNREPLKEITLSYPNFTPSRLEHRFTADAVLLSFMCGGKYLDVIRNAERPLDNEMVVVEEEGEEGEDKDEEEEVGIDVESTLVKEKTNANTKKDAIQNPGISGSPVAGELAFIQQHSPQLTLSNGNNAGHITLPSISDQPKDINHLLRATGSFPCAYPGCTAEPFQSQVRQLSSPIALDLTHHSIC